jgi:hypothetical protein
MAILVGVCWLEIVSVLRSALVNACDKGEVRKATLQISLGGVVKEAPPCNHESLLAFFITGHPTSDL